MKLKDLKTTYNTLCDLDYPVPTELLVHIAKRIRTTERTLSERRKSRMTEEQLIRLENKQRRTLRIYTADSRLIQKKTNEETFLNAIREVDTERASHLGLKIGRKEVILMDETKLRRRIKGYAFIQPGYFILKGSSTAEKLRILNQIDQQQELGWEIEMI